LSEDQFDAWMEANRLNWNDVPPFTWAIAKASMLSIGSKRETTPSLDSSMPSSLMWSAGGLFIAVSFRVGHVPLGAAWCDRHRARFLVHGNRCGLRGRARRLNAVCQGNAYDAPVLLDAQYDIAFVTWGLIIWLLDICRRAKVVASCRRQALTVSRQVRPSISSLEEVDGQGADARLAVAGIGALCV
jgi:hypothetical protein